MLGSARVSRAGFGLAPKRTLPYRFLIRRSEKFACARRTCQHARRVRDPEHCSNLRSRS